MNNKRSWFRVALVLAALVLMVDFSVGISCWPSKWRKEKADVKKADEKKVDVKTEVKEEVKVVAKKRAYKAVSEPIRLYEYDVADD